MSTSADPIKQLTEEDLTEQQIHLIPKLPGQTTDEIKLPTRQVFEYAYKNFTDTNVRKYLEDIQPWLYFRRLHSKQDYSIPELDHTGKPYTELTKILMLYLLMHRNFAKYKVSNKNKNTLNQYQQIHQKLLNLTNLHQHKQHQQQGLNLFL